MKSRKMNPKRKIICSKCKRSFLSFQPAAKYCSDNCRVLSHYHSKIKLKDLTQDNIQLKSIRNV